MTMARTTRSGSWNGDREIDHIGYGSSFGDPGGTVYSDEQRPRISSPGTRAGDIRRQVVEAAADMLRGNKDTSAGASYVEPAYDARFSAEPADRAAVDLYLALLQDRLPVYVRKWCALGPHTGWGGGEYTLPPVPPAPCNFNAEFPGARVAVLSRRAQLT